MSMRMSHEPQNRAMWHSGCPETRFGGVMRPLKETRPLDGDRQQRLWECLHCGQKGWYGVDANGRIRVEAAQP